MEPSRLAALPQFSALDVEFNRAMFRDRAWETVTYRATPICKWPTDLWAYLEAIHEVRPDLIVETGTWAGGSARFFRDAQMLCGIDPAHVVTVDVLNRDVASPSPDIEYLLGSSLDADTLGRVGSLAGEASTVLVSLDSDHTTAHVRRELEAYAGLVTVGSWVVVEDTFIDAFGLEADPLNRRFRSGGPAKAVRQFLRRHPEFEVDETHHRYKLTMNVGGWLRRVA